MTSEMATEQAFACGSYFSSLRQNTWQILKGGEIGFDAQLQRFPSMVS